MKNTRPKNWNPNNTNNPIVKCSNLSCKKEFKRTHNAMRYCEDCRKPKVSDERKAKMKEYKESNKKGYNQSGENNNNWKGGIGVYRELADEYGLPEFCERCESTQQLLVHHKDRNRYNNDGENLERLCKSCHQIEHEAGKNLHPNSPVFKSNKV